MQLAFLQEGLAVRTARKSHHTGVLVEIPSQKLAQHGPRHHKAPLVGAREQAARSLALFRAQTSRERVHFTSRVQLDAPDVDFIVAEPRPVSTGFPK